MDSQKSNKILELKNKFDLFEKQVSDNYDIQKQIIDSFVNFNSIIAVRDDQKFKYSLDIYDSILSIVKNIFIIAVSGYLTSLSLVNINFIDIIYLRVILIKTILISLVIGVIIFLLRYYLIEKIIKIIDDRASLLQDLLQIQNDSIKNLNSGRNIMREMSVEINELEQELN